MTAPDHRRHGERMFETVMAALGGAAGLGALLTPVLLHVTARRKTIADENDALIDRLEQERNTVIARLDQRDAMVADLWDYVHQLRYWMTKGCVGQPPTMPDGLSVAAIRARVTS
jgi:hypothetical protein